MITKAIVEEVISPYEVRIRIPVIDRDSSSPLATKFENLNIAPVCTLPNCYPNIQVGDVVFVGFEDKTYYRAVVLGHLCRDAAYEAFPDMRVNSIEVKSHAELPSTTSIGDVTPEQLSYLQGLKDNIQLQLDDLKQSIAEITSKLDQGGN